MYSSSEDSDSDSGTNFKRGKRKVKAESSLIQDAKQKDDRRHKLRRETSRNITQKTDNDKDNSLKFLEHRNDRNILRHRSRSNDRTDKHDSKKFHFKSPDRVQMRKECRKKKISLSREKESQSQNHRETSPSLRKEYVKVSKKHLCHMKDAPAEAKERFEEPLKHHQRSKSQLKYLKDDKKEGKKIVTINRNSDFGKQSRYSLSHDNETYGPALPPKIKNFKNNVEEYNTSSLIRHSEKLEFGPMIPKDIRTAIELKYSSIENYDIISSDDDENMIGPLPTSSELSERDLELEKRKIEIKLQQLDRRAQAVTNQDMRHREEWMLELPEIRHVADMVPTSRQFRKNNRPDFNDRSSWTKTPNDQHKFKSSYDKLKSDDGKRRDIEVRRRDDEQERQANEYKKTYKRDKTLLQIHEKILKKEKKKNKEEKKERLPFNRETDLSVNKFDEARKKTAFKKAQLLDTRFSSGDKKYL